MTRISHHVKHRGPAFWPASVYATCAGTVALLRWRLCAGGSLPPASLSVCTAFEIMPQWLLCLVSANIGAHFIDREHCNAMASCSLLACCSPFLHSPPACVCCTTRAAHGSGKHPVALASALLTAQLCRQLQAAMAIGRCRACWHPCVAVIDWCPGMV